ncbi:MAG: hypothetical protein AAFX39_01655 [Pseudomonadota bacterium]
MPVESEIIGRFKVLCDEIAGANYQNIDALFELTASDDAPAEIRDLAEAFGSMIVQVETREFSLSQVIEDLRETQRQLEEAQKQLVKENATLKTKVRRLQIEIDQSEKEREVSEIADSDYFQDLQSQARAMRARYKGTS